MYSVNWDSSHCSLENEDFAKLAPVGNTSLLLSKGSSASLAERVSFKLMLASSLANCATLPLHPVK
jgi:hypothetical protein